MRKNLLLALVLGICAVLLCCVSAMAASSGTCGDNLTWTLDDEGLLTISGTGTMTEAPWGKEIERVVINPGVTSIGDRAFSDCSSLTSITIPESVTSIGIETFYNCSSLTSITLPEGVTSIGNAAFAFCRSLTGITIPEGVTSIGDDAFVGCGEYLYAKIGSNGAKSLGKAGYSFREPGSNFNLRYLYNNEEITGLDIWNVDNDVVKILIPEGVTSIGGSAFYNCSSLTSIMIPDSVTSIDSNAFEGCSSLKSITISEGVTSIGISAFWGCSSLTSFTIPEGVTSIEGYTFYGCSSLKSITIPEGVTSIGGSAFYNCSSLTSITIPEGVTSIGSSAFSGCDKLTSITIPNGVTIIEYATFYHCSSLKSITIPESVTSIGSDAFFGCSSLTDITIPGSVTSIGSQAFDDCNSLKSITIPEGVTSIEDSAFFGCSSLTSITIPESVTSIGDHAFYNCNSLTSIMIPECVTSIEYEAFYNCSSLTSITIPEGVTSIDNYTFDHCSSLTSITIPEGVTSIGDYAFSYCRSLTGITIPEGVTSIGEYAFGYCGELRKIEIPDSVVTFGNNIFGDNTSVTVYCNQLSDADYWADSLGLSIVYLDLVPASEIRTLSIEDNFNLPIGVTRKLIYNIFPMNDSPSVSLVSSNPEVASIENGYITGISGGSCVITAECDSVSASVTVTVYKGSTGFELSSDEEWVIARDNLVLSVVDLTPVDTDTDLDLTWKSSDEEYAAVDASGAVHTSRPGDVTISVMNARGLTHTCLLHICYPVTEIAFEPVQETIVPNRDVQLTANVTMRTQTCVNHLVTFTSSNEEIAVVDEMGLVHTLSEGEVTITATSASNKTDSITLFIDHDWGEPQYDWAETKDSITAQRVCQFDNSHIETETKPVTGVVTKQPTCTDMGETTYTSEAFDNETFSVQTRTFEDVEALGHNWGEPQYTWNDDNTEVTATRICGNDVSHIETEIVAVSSDITKPATCTDNGETTYTSADFENEAFSGQTKTLDDIPALQHAWGEAIYTWSVDNTQVTATRICKNDTEHVETEEKNVTSEITKQPTCSTMGETTYTSDVFENEVFSVQTKTLKDVDIDPSNHSWGEPTYEWSDDNNTVTATRICGRNTDHEDTEIVTSKRILITAPTETTVGIFKWTAVFENPVLTVQEKAGGTIPPMCDMNVLILPTALKTIETEAFDNVAAEAIILPDTVTAIEPKAFTNCMNLQYIRIPVGVTIPDDTFEGSQNVVVDQ